MIWVIKYFIYLHLVSYRAHQLSNFWIKMQYIGYSYIFLPNLYYIYKLEDLKIRTASNKNYNNKDKDKTKIWVVRFLANFEGLDLGGQLDNFLKTQTAKQIWQ